MMLVQINIILQILSVISSEFFQTNRIQQIWNQNYSEYQVESNIRH